MKPTLIQIEINGGEVLTVYCVKEDGLTFSTEPIKKFTLIDKFGKHLVFVNWEAKESFALNTNDNVDEYIVGKEYAIKIPNTNL